MAKEGLGFARFVLVLSSLSPLFLLWAIRGTGGFDDRYWVPLCAGAFILPTAFLWLQIRRARRVQNRLTVMVSEARDQREHLLVYLFAMMIPVYDANLGGWRDLVAVLVAFLFVVFVFWHMRLHYMKLGVGPKRSEVGG